MLDMLIFLFWLGLIIVLAGFVFNFVMMMIFFVFSLFANLFQWIAEQVKGK